MADCYLKCSFYWKQIEVAVKVEVEHINVPGLSAIGASSGANNSQEVLLQQAEGNAGYFRKCFKKEYGITPSEVTNGGTA